MNQRRHISIIAACATIMGAFPLTALFQLWTWFLQAILLVAMVAAAAIGARALRAPVWAQPLVGLIVLCFGVTWVYGHGHAYGALIPDADTARYLGSVAGHVGRDLNEYAAPAPDVASFLFVTATSVALCAIAVDLLAVGLRRPALAGLPILGMYVVAMEVDRHDVPIWTFIVAALGYLWLLVSDSIDRVRTFGRRFTGDGRSVDLWESSPLATTGRWIAVVGVAVALALPAIFPGVGPGIAHRASAGTGLGTGPCTGVCAGGVNMFAALRGQLNETQTVQELTVRTDEDHPAENLRLGVADQLTKAGFASTAYAGVPLGNPPTNIRNAKATQHEATVTIAGLTVDLLPIYLDPDTSSFSGVDGWAFDASSETVFAPHSTTRGLSYRFSYYEPQPTAEQLRAVGPIAVNNALMSDATVPQDLPLVDQIVTQQTAGASGEYDTVRALENYLSPENGFAYSLSTKVGTSGSDIVDFLTNKQGFCVQYAATLAWLVRAAHYPARVAFGFLGGTRAADGSYTMTNHDLHAWTEVWFPSYGWMPFDATPGVSNKILAQYDQPATTPSSTAPSAATANPIGPRGRPTEPTTTAGGPATGSGTNSGGPMWLAWTLLGIFVAAALAVSPALVRVLRRRRRTAGDHAHGGDPEAAGRPWVVADSSGVRLGAARRAHAAWEEFQDTLVDFEVPINPAESPIATCERVVRITDLSEAARGGVRTIGRVEQVARYAREPARIGSLDRELRRFRRELAGNVPLTTRLRANLLPPSVIAVWHEALAARWTATTAGAVALSERLARLLRLRAVAAAPRRALAGRAGRAGRPPDRQRR